jgi:hypothetical protein
LGEIDPMFASRLVAATPRHPTAIARHHTRTGHFRPVRPYRGILRDDRTRPLALMEFSFFKHHFLSRLSDNSPDEFARSGAEPVKKGWLWLEGIGFQNRPAADDPHLRWSK